MIELAAKDIMDTDFKTIHPDVPVKKAVRLIFEGKTRTTGYKTISLMVTDDLNQLVGVISMFDVLYHLRPAFLNYGLDSISLWQGELEPYLEHFNHLTVEQIMTGSVLTVKPDDHLMVVIDRMVKKKLRRLPVVEDNKILGIVYISDVFSRLCQTWLKSDFE